MLILKPFLNIGFSTHRVNFFCDLYFKTGYFQRTINLNMYVRKEQIYSDYFVSEKNWLFALLNIIYKQLCKFLQP